MVGSGFHTRNAKPLRQRRSDLLEGAPAPEPSGPPVSLRRSPQLLRRGSNRGLTGRACTSAGPLNRRPCSLHLRRCLAARGKPKLSRWRWGTEPSAGRSGARLARRVSPRRRAACPSSGGPAGPRPEPMPRLVLPAAIPRVVDGKPRVTSFLRTDTVRRVGRGRTRQGTDPHPPETSALQGRGSHQESTSLPSLVQAPYYACPRRLGSPPCGRPWSAAPYYATRFE
jgi:hypothetical protein